MLILWHNLHALKLYIFEYRGALTGHNIALASKARGRDFLSLVHNHGHLSEEVLYINLYHYSYFPGALCFGRDLEQFEVLYMHIHFEDDDIYFCTKQSSKRS